MEKSKREEKEFKDALNKLRKDLKGKQTLIAEELKVDPSYINRILSGTRTNIDVLNQIVLIRDRMKKESAEKFKKFISEV